MMNAARKSPALIHLPECGEEKWLLKLYVAGQTQKSVTAFVNLEKICEEHLEGRYRIEVIDLLVRLLPHPMKKIIGDLSNKEKVLVGFSLLSIC